jgi:zinc D-Ala-D-Ala carboxypeptidase
MLSKHFSTLEFTHSDTAVEHGINNELPPALNADAIWFAEDVLEAIRSLIGKPIRITSGYRCVDLNQRIGGAHNSYHMKATAADITVKGMTAYELAQTISISQIPFDKVIQEHGRWVHVQGRPPGRKECFTATKKNHRTVYIEGISR